jgi:chloramphenicol-sensitive protein RarD
VNATERQGTLFAIAAYVAWGFFPAFWKLFGGIDAFEILAYRWVWATVFFLALLGYRERRSIASKLNRLRSAWKVLALSGFLIGLNWLIYVYAVNTGQVLESSLGYFLSPMVQVGLGVLVLKERLNPRTALALLAAGLGVLALILQASTPERPVPWIALSLSVSFGFYGLVRKRSGLDPMSASTFEMLLFFPLMLGALLYRIGANPDGDHGNALQQALFVLGGVVTGLPLLWYTEAAKRIPMTSMGFFQYIAPVLQFALAVFVYGEAFRPAQWMGFGLIWVALGIYTFDLLRRQSLRKAYAA